MKAEELLYSLEHLDEDLLAGAEQTILVRKRLPWAGAAAAAVLLIALGLGGFFLMKQLRSGTDPAAVGGPSGPDPVSAADTEPEPPDTAPDRLTVGDCWTGRSRAVYDDLERSMDGARAAQYDTGKLVLPIFERQGGALNDPELLYGKEELLARLDRAAAWIGVSLRDEATWQTDEIDGASRVEAIHAETDQGTLTVCADGKILMLFDEAHAITSNIKVQLAGSLTQEETVRVLRDARMWDCGERLAERLGLGEFRFVTCDRWDPTSSAWTAFTIYPVRSDPAEQLVARYFESVRLLTNDGWTLRGFELDRLPREDGAEAPEGLRLVGRYGVRDASQANADVLNEIYLCEERLDADPLSLPLRDENLVYLPDAGHRLLMPFYRFWVPANSEADCVEYIAVYVPAVIDACLADFPPAETVDAGLEALLTAPERWHCAEGRSIRELVLRQDRSFVYSVRGDFPNFRQELSGSWALRGDRLFLLATDGQSAEYEIRALDEDALELEPRSEIVLSGELRSRSFRAFPKMETELPDLPRAYEQATNEIRSLFASDQGWYSRALTSEYGRPEDADLGALFRNGIPKEDGPLSVAELEALRRVLGEDFEAQRPDYGRLPAAEIDAVLDLLYGTSLEKLAALRGADAAALLGPDFTYLPDFDCYYFLPGTGNQLSPSVRDVMRPLEGLEDYFLVRYRADVYSFTEGNWLLLLERRDGAYRVLANAEESAYLPLRTLALASEGPASPERPAATEPDGSDSQEIPRLRDPGDGSFEVVGPAGTVKALQYMGDCEDPVWADLNRDGRKELIYWCHGPTSGLFTIGLCVYGLEQGWPVLKDGVLYNLDWGQLRLTEEDGQVFLRYERSQWDPATQTSVAQPEQPLSVTLEDGKLVLNGGKAPEGCELWGSSDFTRFGRSFSALEQEVKDSCFFKHWACLVWAEPSPSYGSTDTQQNLCAAASTNGVTVTGYLRWLPQPNGTFACSGQGIEAITPPKDPAALVGLSLEELNTRYGPAHFDMGSGLYIPCWITRDRKLLVVHAADTVLSAELWDLTAPPED